MSDFGELRLGSSQGRDAMRYLHTMVRVKDLDSSLYFYCDLLGLREVRRINNEKGRFTLVFLAAPDDEACARDAQSPLVELTSNWDPEEYGGGRNFGHLAYMVEDIYAACETDEGRHHNQSSAARWPYGVRPLPRRHIHRASAER